MTAVLRSVRSDDLHELDGERLAKIRDALVLAGLAEIERLCERPARHSAARMTAIAAALHCLDKGEPEGAA